MSYIVVSTRDVHIEGLGIECVAFSRRAVPTLDDAQAMVPGTPEVDYRQMVDENGGTVALPDGTTIEVKRVGMLERSAFTVANLLSARLTDEEWCAAWNAKHGTEA